MKIKLYLTILALVSFVLFLPSTILAVPAIPLYIYGDVSIGGVAVPVGTTISAEVSSVEVASVATTQSGKYGIEVSPDDCNVGDTVELKVNGVKGGQGAYVDPDTTPTLEVDLATYTLTINISPDSSGAVTLSPSDSDLITSGAQYTLNSSVSLTAQGSGSYGFSSWTGDLTGSTNPDTITMTANKTVTSTFTTNPAPTASPVAGTYHATQSVSLTASGSTAICYTTDDTMPACSSSIACTTGSVYGSAISVTLTDTIKSIACYADDSSSSVSSDTYTLTCATASVSNGTVAAYPGCAITCNSGYTLSNSTCVASGGSAGGGGGGDTTAPSISSIAVIVNSTDAAISWTTNESSLSWVVYGASTAYGLEKKTTTYITSHSLALTGLTPETTYHYQVKSKDSTGNIGAYTDKTFTTLAGAPTETAAGSATVSAEGGGSAAATTDQGTTVSLEMPAGAVSVESQVTITPTASAAESVSTEISAVPTTQNIVGGYVYSFVVESGGESVTVF